MNRWRFAAVTVPVTTFDVAMAVGGATAGLSLVVADAIALVVAAVASFLLHRRLTLGSEPRYRWVRHPGSVATIATFTGLIDLLVFVSVASSDPSTGRLLTAKICAVGIAAGFRALAYRGLLMTLVAETHASPPGRPGPAGQPRLSVVVPAYRAAEEISTTVTRIRHELGDVAASGGLQIVVVDDGSPDDTAAVARAAGADVVLEQRPNRGKGAAVRAGMLAATGRYRVFTDADLSYSPDQIRTVLEHLELGWDAVVGTRHHTDTQTLVRARRLRELTGRVFNRLTSWVLLGGYLDTQCGLKGFRSDVALDVFGHSSVDGFAFDVEVLHLIERRSYALEQIPVVLEARDDSTVRVGHDAMAMVRDIARVRRHAAAGLYDRAPAAALDPADPAGG